MGLIIATLLGTVTTTSDVAVVIFMVTASQYNVGGVGSCRQEHTFYCLAVQVRLIKCYTIGRGDW